MPIDPAFLLACRASALDYPFRYPAQDMAKYESKIERNGQAPYLGCPDGQFGCMDASQIPVGTTAAYIWPKCKNLDQLSSHHSLVEVQAQLTQEIVAQLKALPNLKRVQFSLPRTDRIPKLEPLSQLETLVLCCNKHQTNINFINGMASLRNLCVSEAMGVSKLTAIGKLPKLEELYIDGQISRRNTVQSLAPIGRLRELKYLVLLLRLPKEKRTLKPLSKLKNLRFLYLSDDYSDEEYFALLRNLPTLELIHFNGGKTVSLPPNAG